MSDSRESYCDFGASANVVEEGLACRTHGDDDVVGECRSTGTVEVRVDVEVVAGDGSEGRL